MKHSRMIAVILPLFAILACEPNQASRKLPDTLTVTGDKAMPKYVIRVIRTTHCARGPKLCDKCREMDGLKICLLDIDPPNHGREARRTIELVINGKREWREFDVIKTFADEAEARRYAAENGIIDMDLTR